MRGESDYRQLTSALAQRKHAQAALEALVGLSRQDCESIEFLLSVYRDVHHVAHHGVSRQSLNAPPDETGRRGIVLNETIKGTSRFAPINPKAKSAPPSYDPRAQALMRKAKRQMQKLADDWLNELDGIVGEAAE